MARVGCRIATATCRCLLILTFLLISLPVSLLAAETEHDATTSDVHSSETSEVYIEGKEEEHHDIHPAHAVLFPVFTMTIGVVAFYVLSRHLEALPYTATLFLLGTVMGIGAELSSDRDDHINETLRLWIPIDSEVLLLVFLPGLIFKDSFGLNVHLLSLSLGQCLIFAFPLVLAGTSLTAMIAKYIFPYDWPLDLAFTFGSILSATDPVAVAALMEQVGAPPRLKIHVAGESFLNDGAAIVFFSIFSMRYYYLLNIEGLGEEIGWGEGIKMFFQKSMGGVAIGIFFGLGLLFLMHLLNRRFSKEENVVEVMATAAIAYTGYYVSEVVWGTSGVIATLTCGVVVKGLGRATINDAKLLDEFWALVEHILNTVLFTLGGVVWGAVIARGESEGAFRSQDWGYLLLLYVLLHVIRFGLFFSVYPITKSIGLSTNVKETFFQVYGGLRGAIGIALALSLDNRLREENADKQFLDQTTKVFGFVGGIAFLTLVINGVTAAPLIRALGLTQSSETRRKILKAYETRYKVAVIDEMVRLLSQPRFHTVNFAFVKHHVPLLNGMTKQQLRDSVQKHRDTTPPDQYSPPFLKRVIPYLEDDPEEVEYQRQMLEEQAEDVLDTFAYARKLKREERTRQRRRRGKSSLRVMLADEPLGAKELRLLFLSILRAAYEKQISDGEMIDREYLTVALFQSLDCATDAVEKGEPLRDFDFVNLVGSPVSKIYESYKTNAWLRNLARPFETIAHTEHTLQRLTIECSIAFTAAHCHAAAFFKREFEEADKDLEEAAKLVLMESTNQAQQAATLLKKHDLSELELVISHKFCAILLNSSVKYIEKLVSVGMMSATEAEHVVEEIQHDLDHVNSCQEKHHPGELPEDSYRDEKEQEALKHELSIAFEADFKPEMPAPVEEE